MIFAAYSCPDDFFTHLRTTEKAPLRRKKEEHKQPKKSVLFHIAPAHTYIKGDIWNGIHSCGSDFSLGCHYYRSNSL